MRTSTRNVYRLLLIFFCTNFYTPAHATTKKKQPWLTILVHGIISVKPFLSPYNIYILMQDDIHNSVYAHTIGHARKDPFFHRYHAMQEQGLKKIDTSVVAPGAGASAFARAYNRLATHLDTENQNIYYTYGWSALLSKKMWEHEALKFYHTLCKEIESYRKKGFEPKIRIIGYSHGGTIAIHLAHAQQKSGHKAPISVDELITIGMPATQEVKPLIENPLFKKVYHIYSYGDRVQTFDIFSLNVLLAKRTFSGTSKKPLPKKLHQIGLKMYRLANFCTAKCCKGHPTWPAPPKHVRNVHPGHSELWSFAWTGPGYRDYMPIAPLPMAACIPWFTHLADMYQEDSCSITIAMHPYCNHTNICCHKTGSTKTQPFITASVLEKMRKDARQFYPHEFTPKEYEKHIQSALRLAHDTVRVRGGD